MNYVVEVPTEQDLEYINALSQESQNQWYFDSIMRRSDMLYQHITVDNRVFAVFRDDTVIGALIWPVLVYEFTPDRSIIQITRLDSLSLAIDWVDLRVTEQPPTLAA